VTQPRQLSLVLDLPVSRATEDFLVADCNRDAVRWIERWPAWPSPALVLYGADGCGKTHLAHVFVARSGGTFVEGDALSMSLATGKPDGAVACAIDDADRLVAAGPETAFLHLYNALAERGAKLLLTAHAPPSRWPIGLADLRSRLAAALSVGIGAPDDELIAGVLVKLFADRQVRVDDEVILYALPRIQRSFAAARRLVEQLDAAALASRRPISLQMIRELLRHPGEGSTFG
jgi:chromosomal replication initiation ATPase DnaA